MNPLKMNHGFPEQESAASHSLNIRPDASLGVQPATWPRCDRTLRHDPSPDFAGQASYPNSQKDRFDDKTNRLGSPLSF